MTSLIQFLAIAVLILLSHNSVAFAPTKSTHTVFKNDRDHVNFTGPINLITSGVATKRSRLHASQLFHASAEKSEHLNPIKASLTKAGMIAFVASMCVALPITLFPAAVLHKTKIISTTRKEKASLRIGQSCSRWLMRIIPFAKINVMTNDDEMDQSEPSIWVCNHTSMLDIFFLLATDKKLRGKNKRPIKIIYWKGLEKNPVTGLLFKMCGFLPVDMEANGSGNTNSYKTSSFKSLLRGMKKAFDEGWDIGILPEGQLNPSPEKGLQPVFSGAFTMARMSKRPIRMMGIHGLHKLWHGDENIGMTVTGRQVNIRAYPFGCKFDNSDQFEDCFKSVVGHFGAHGYDHPDWRSQMNENCKPKEVTSN